MTPDQRDTAVHALQTGDRAARIETDNLQSYMMLRPGCLNEREVADFYDRRREFSNLRENAGSWRDAEDDVLHKALVMMRDNAKLDEQLAAKMKRRAKSPDC
jgi:hypothetical protein